MERLASLENLILKSATHYYAKRKAPKHFKKINKTGSKSNDTPSSVCTSNQMYKINQRLCCVYQYNPSKRLKRRNSFEILHSSPESVPSPHKAPRSITGFQSMRVFRIYQSINQPANHSKIKQNRTKSKILHAPECFNPPKCW
jgi:hypothetical protein